MLFTGIYKKVYMQHFKTFSYDKTEEENINRTTKINISLFTNFNKHITFYGILMIKMLIMTSQYVHHNLLSMCSIPGGVDR